MALAEVRLPDTGDSESVEVIELCAGVGDRLSENEAVVVVETDKATLEVGVPSDGVISELKVSVGDQLVSGQVIALYEAEAKAPRASGSQEAAKPAEKAKAQKAPSQAKPTTRAAPAISASAAPQALDHSGPVYAGPAVRKLARELGVDLGKVVPTGARGRTLKDDVTAYVRARLTGELKTTALPVLPKVDFAAFGPTHEVELSRIRRSSARNLHRSWVNIPHVTQFDEADATALMRALNESREEGTHRKVKLTPLALIMRACITTLKAYPRVNASLNEAMTHWIYKEYWHMAFAVDTDDGLLVPVVRDADQKDLWALAEKISALAEKARSGKLAPGDMQGGTFTISSLGRIGGTGFAPVVNGPQAAILGVSRLTTKPHWNGESFEPRQVLPLGLSYDHRVIDGAEAGRFMVHLCEEIARTQV